MTDLSALARRVMDLQGPSREVDDLILQAIGWTIKPHPYSWEKANWIDPSGALTAHRQGDWWFKPTASLDAAMTLIADDLVFNLGNDIGYCWAHVWKDDPLYDGKPFEGLSATPALALTAAALLARGEQS